MNLKQIYKLMKVSASKDPAHKYLSKSYIKDGKIYATDGYRLMAIATDKPIGYCDFCDDGISVYNIEYKTDRPFPDVNTIIPSQDDISKYQKIEITLPKIKVIGGESQAYITKRNTVEFNDSSEKYTGDYHVSVNWKYLELLAGETVNMWIRDKFFPIIIEQMDKFTSGDWFYLVMPMRGKTPYQYVTKEVTIQYRGFELKLPEGLRVMEVTFPMATEKHFYLNDFSLPVFQDNPALMQDISVYGILLAKDSVQEVN